MQVFYSYSHKDEALRDELAKYLKPLERQGLIQSWHDRCIGAGTEWANQIDDNLNAADIILLLVSPDFIASDYCYDIEVKRAIERYDAGTAKVIPIILRPCGWQDAPFGKLQSLPKDIKPITKWEDRDEAFLDVVNGIREVLKTLILPKFSSISSTLNPHPPKVTNWVGREDAITQIQDWIVDPSVTLIGIQGLGGVGKSALAAHIYDKFCRGEINSTSSPIRNFQWADVSQKPDFVAFAEGIVSGLGGKIIQAGDINLVVNQLINFLNQQPCLLVVDNLETLLTESEDWQDSGYEKFFSRWIGQESNSTLLLTTREKPNLFQGWQNWYSLEGLKPKKGAQLLQELKIQGTEAALEAFAQSVDGHPLTLRLVATFLREYCGGDLSRVDELGLQQEELIFEQAEGQHHETDARLSWILDQHLQRLTDQEKCFLLNLTFYRQTFDSEAAVWMWDEGDGEAKPAIKPFRILKELATLRNRSLLLEIGGNRFQFQFLIQRYLQQILVRQYLHPQGTDFSFAHQQALKYYLSHLKPEPWDSLDDVGQYLEACYHHCQLQQYAQAYEIVERCHTFLNLRGYYQKLLEVYGTLAREWQPESIEDKDKWAWAWTRQGYAYFSIGEYRSAIQCQRQAQQIFCDICNHRGEARALRSLGFAYVSIGEYQQAIKLFQRCLGICRGIGQHQEKMIALRGLGFAYVYLTEYRRAIRFYEKSLKIAKEIGDRMGESSALSGLGNAYYRLGEYWGAIDFHQQSLAIRKEIGDHQGEACSLSNLGNAYYQQGEYQRAINFHQQDLEITREIGDRQGESGSLGNLGNAYYSLGEYQRTIDFHQQALKITREIGDRQWESGSLGNLGYAYLAIGDYEQAIKLLQQSVKIASDIGDRYVKADSLTRLGKAYDYLGQSQQAIEFHRQSLKIAQEIGQRDVEADAYCGLADIYRSLEKYTEARDYYQQSRNIAKEINYHRGEADASFNLGLALTKLNSSSEAVTALQNARQLYQEMGLDVKVKKCDSEIEKIGQF